MKSKHSKRTPVRSKRAHRSLALPDSLAPGLEIVSIGINPSVYSALHGFNFARPGNRFWPTFNAADIVPEPLEPGRAAVIKLLRDYRIGFTDIAKRATERADELTDEDYRRGALILKRKLLRHQPVIAWFQGISAFQKYLQFAEGAKRTVRPGLQPERIGTTLIFVTPNPSGANPAANPKALRPWYRELKRLRDRCAASVGKFRPSAARSRARRC
ncbi:MAG TPA: mismatch-specific DNA-glycosylase [Xanthobacteraceae bacterium]|nr:mismatch-specific DNA-glycosylase [Xanthobacteraceae bacterium]